jgi:DNA helicase-2/ATP-dependent DNA helicase PcrA
VTDEAFSEQMLVGLTPEQREAVNSHARRLMVRATAGSGKTHVLTLRIQRRILEGELSPDQVLAMTFTRKAGDELRKRLFRAGIRDVRAGTFHRAALTIVSRYREDHNLRPYALESHRARLVTSLAAQLTADGEMAIADWQLPRVEQELGWALSQGLTGVTYSKSAKKLKRDSPLPVPIFAEFIDRYIGMCQAKHVLDFDLLLREAITLLQTDKAVRDGFRHTTPALFVDETQDMNPLQFSLLREMAGDDPDLFCVGDPNQSIYGFNGANPQLMTEVLQTWPDTQVLDLTRNHRSTASIIAVASTLLEAGAKGIVPAREDGEVPLIRAYDTDTDEANAVATWLCNKHSVHSSWRSMAVLARTNRELERMATALEFANIPFERRGADHSPASDLVGTREVNRRVVDTEHPDAVALSTIHRAKGLEFQHVACVGWAEGVLPNYNAQTDDQIAEEQRLAYVALSRAEQSLFISYSKAKDEPKFPNREQSRFLTPVIEKVKELEKIQSPLTGDARKNRLAELRAALDANSPQG